MDKKKKRVLYIEDDQSSYLLIKRLLKNSDVTLVQAEDSLKGLELVKKQDFALILIDINMSGLNGYETATRLKMLKSKIFVAFFNTKRSEGVIKCILIMFIF